MPNDNGEKEAEMLNIPRGSIRRNGIGEKKKTLRGRLKGDFVVI
jgi:hypothetical protein